MNQKILSNLDTIFWTAFYKIYDFIQAEGQRLYLWYPIAFGSGIGVYFTLQEEPSIINFLFLLIVSIFLLYDFRKTSFQYLTILFFLFCLGLNIARIQTYAISENSIKGRSKKIEIAGKIENVSLNDQSKYKVVLDKVYIPTFESWQTPKKIRITFPENTQHLSIGDYIQTEAMLMPLQGNASVYSTNIARNAYFRKIGGIGYSKKAPILSFKNQTKNLNDQISTKLKNDLARTEYGIAKALILGDAKEIPKSITNDYRIAGISHLLAISGLHLGLISGFIFCILRFFCSCISPIALNYNTKKISAIFTLIFSFFYLKLSDFPISACRAYIMLAFAMIAVLFDRKALSIANVAWASMLILLFKPDALLSISFQLSFSAVFGLVAFTESPYSKILSKINTPIPVLNKILQMIGNILIYSFIAVLFTLPVTLYHFNILTTYSLLGNLCSTWIMGFWVMPYLFLGMLFFNFSCSALFFKIAGIGIHFISSMAHYITSLPQNSFIFPQIPLTGLILGIFGLLWLGIWTTKPRFIGLILLILSLFSPIFTNKPDIYLTQNNIIFRLNKKLYIPSFSKNNFMIDTWLKENAQSKILTFDCPETGCILNIKNKKIAISSKQKNDKIFCDDESFDLKILYSKQNDCANSIQRTIDKTKLIYLLKKETKIEIPGNNFRPWHPSYPKVFLPFKHE